MTHRTFTVYFDEPAQMATARTVAGGPQWRLFDAATWQPGFGILLAPLYAFIDDPSTVYRLAIVVNALLGGVAFMLLTLVGRELTGRRLAECAGPAFVISLLPSSIVASAYVWSEQLLIVVTLATMLATMRFVRSSRLPTALLSIALAAYGYLAHGRLLPLIAITTFIVGATFVRARQWRNLGYSIGCAVAAMAIVMAISAAIRERIWTNPQDENTVGATLGRLRDPIAVLDAAIGQLWYLAVASLGFIVFGVLAAWRLMASGDRRATVRVLTAYVLSSFALSAVFMSGRTIRTDMLIYGRYNEAFIGPVLLIGWFEFVRRIAASQRSALAGACSTALTTAALALTVHFLHGRELLEGEAFLLMVPALAALDSTPGTRVLIPTVVSVTVLAALFAVAWLCGARSKVLTLTVTLVVAIGVLRVGSVITYAEEGDLSSSEISQMRASVPPSESIVLRVIPANESILYGPAKQRTRLQQYQFLVPEQRFDLELGLDGSSGQYVLAPQLTTSLVRSDATILWDDPNSPMALWYVP